MQNSHGCQSYSAKHFRTPSTAEAPPVGYRQPRAAILFDVSVGQAVVVLHVPEVQLVAQPEQVVAAVDRVQPEPKGDRAAEPDGVDLPHIRRRADRLPADGYLARGYCSFPRGHRGPMCVGVPDAAPTGAISVDSTAPRPSVPRPRRAHRGSAGKRRWAATSIAICYS